jgi:hypothetical protein
MSRMKRRLNGQVVVTLGTAKYQFAGEISMKDLSQRTRDPALRPARAEGSGSCCALLRLSGKPLIEARGRNLSIVA